MGPTEPAPDSKATSEPALATPAVPALLPIVRPRKLRRFVPFLALLFIAAGAFVVFWSASLVPVTRKPLRFDGDMSDPKGQDLPPSKMGGNPRA